MKYYVAAFDSDGLQILGSLDGQGVFECKNYKRTQWYKRLSTRKTLNNRVMEYWIFNANSQDFSPLEKIANTTHPGWY